MGSFGAFDFEGIRQDCWQQCEKDPRSYNDGSTLPIYRLFFFLLNQIPFYLPMDRLFFQSFQSYICPNLKLRTLLSEWK